MIDEDLFQDFPMNSIDCARQFGIVLYALAATGQTSSQCYFGSAGHCNCVGSVLELHGQSIRQEMHLQSRHNALCSCSDRLFVHSCVQSGLVLCVVRVQWCWYQRSFSVAVVNVA